MNHLIRIAQPASSNAAPLRRSVREVLMSPDNRSPAAALPVQDLPAAAPDTPGKEQYCDRPPPRVWNSADLLGTESEALILHRGQTYRLRCTKQGKLILYK